MKTFTVLCFQSVKSQTQMFCADIRNIHVPRWKYQTCASVHSVRYISNICTRILVLPYSFQQWNWQFMCATINTWCHTRLYESNTIHSEKKPVSRHTLISSTCHFGSYFVWNLSERNTTTEPGLTLYLCWAALMSNVCTNW